MSSGAQNQYSLRRLSHGHFRIRVYNESPVKAPYPFGFVGDGLTQCVVLALPDWRVHGFLPGSLQLGEQDVTPVGTHPVVLLFHSFTQCQFSFPTFLPPMQFHEQTIGIPFTYIRANNSIPGGSGPYCFIPKFYLDDQWVWMIGRTYWGFDKEMAFVNSSNSLYAVTSLAGRRLVSLEWQDYENEVRSAIRGYPEFESVRLMLSQPLVSLSPAGVGPVLTLTDFDRSWNLGTVRPINGALEIDASYLPGFEGGYYATGGADADAPLLSSYELSVQWWLSFPYLPSGSLQEYP
jgi:hypothetical protein